MSGVSRVDHLNYPSHECLSSISRDELALLFYEKAILWGGTLNFSITEFAKCPQILNMVMAFVHTQWSHYNTIIEPRTITPSLGLVLISFFLSRKIFL